MQRGRSMLYFVVNPSSKSNYGQLIWDEIEEELKMKKVRYRCLKTRRKKDAIRFARKLTAGNHKNQIVILGGDGTLNEFLNGMLRTENIELAYLPIGSGNDFARGMHISKEYKKELAIILSGKCRREVDYGIVTYQNGRKKRFFVSSGMGYDARVCYEVDHTKWKKFLNGLKLGKLIYLLIGVRDLIGAKTFYGTLKLDGKTVLNGEGFLFVSFHNLPYEGGGFCFCPKAQSGDGYLDVCVAKGIAKWKIPFIIPLAIAGKHAGRKGIYQMRCKEAVIKANPRQYVHTDGETKKLEKEIKISVSNKKVIFMN